VINEKSVVPGDIKRLEVMIDGKDVTAAVLDARLFFDIIGAVWTAQIYFEDSTNLLSTLPIKSGAKVKIKAATKFESVGDDEKEFNYVVYNITDKISENHMQYTYTVHCACPAFLVDQKKRVQKYFEGAADNAVSSITSEFLGGSIGETRAGEGSVQFIASNWTPLNTIAWVAKWATYNGKADYLFFQSDNDVFDFMPIEAMFKESSRDTGLTFFQRPAGIRENHEYRDDPALTFTAQQNDHYDALKAGLSGYFASRNVTFDFVKKKWREEEYRSGGAEGGDNEFSDMVDAAISFTPSHPGMYAGSQNIYDTFKDWTGSRRGELMKLEREKIFIQTPCAIGAWKWLGRAVKIDLPSMEDMTNDPYDKLRRGKYLITAVALMLNKADAATNYEMVKIELEGGK
jgi:hypothetical protein